MAHIKILIADEHTLFRESLASLLGDQPDMDVVGEASLLSELLVKVDSAKPNLILIEAAFSDGDTLEAIKSILAGQPDIAIILFTSQENDELLFNALQNGAKGYLLKNISKLTLVDAIRGVLNGEPALTRSMMGKILADYILLSKLAARNQLINSTPTYRETEVLHKLAAGYSNREISHALSISENTVRVHVRNILDKLNVKNRYEAGDYARRFGLLNVIRDDRRKNRQK